MRTAFIKTNYTDLNRVSINLVDMGAAYQPGIVGTYPSGGHSSSGYVPDQCEH